MMFKIWKAPEYSKWLAKQTAYEEVQIEKRLSKIEKEGHFGVHKYLKDAVWELKWECGRRLYYAYIPEKQILLLLGGNKNAQEKDINKAKKILKTNAEIED